MEIENPILRNAIAVRQRKFRELEKAQDEWTHAIHEAFTHRDDPEYYRRASVLRDKVRAMMTELGIPNGGCETSEEPTDGR